MRENNHKKRIHFLERPIIGPGAQTINEKTINHTWEPPATAERPQINIGKGYAFRSRSRTIQVPTIHAIRRHQSFVLQDSGSHKKFIRTKQDGSQLHQARAISISWSPIIITQTQSMQNLSRQYQAWI